MNLAKSILGIVLLVLIILSSAFADVPAELNYQGKLTDDLGINVTDGDYSITFKIYDVVTGGVELWSETQLVAVSNGLFAVSLGLSFPIDPAMFANPDLWMGITVDANPEFDPRTKFESVPYAFRAQTVSDTLQIVKLETDTLHVGHIVLDSTVRHIMISPLDIRYRYISSNDFPMTTLLHTYPELITVHPSANYEGLAPIHLPDGAILSKIILYKAGGSMFANLQLIRHELLEVGEELMGSIDTYMSNDGPDSVSTTSIINPLIDNINYTYRIQFPEVGTGMLVKGVLIEYIVVTPLP